MYSVLAGRKKILPAFLLADLTWHPSVRLIWFLCGGYVWSMGAWSIFCPRFLGCLLQVHIWWKPPDLTLVFVSRGGAYQAPPSLGNTTNPNEIALASLGGALPGVGGGAPSAEIIDAHLAVQGTIRSYQVKKLPRRQKYYSSSFFQVRGHLAAQIDPLGLNNMEREKAKKMIIRSVTVDQKVHSWCDPSVLTIHILHIVCPSV